MVQRTGVRGISRYGRASQGVKVMNVREDDTVSAVALVVETSTSTAAGVDEDELGGDGGLPDAEEGPVEITAGSGADGAANPDADEAWAAAREPLASAPRSALMAGPGKGGGPKLSDSSYGTL